VLAILIWFGVEFSMNKDVSPWAALIGRSADETVLSVHVSVPALEARAVMITPQEVQVTLRGDPRLLKNLPIADVHALVNLTGVESASGLRRQVEIALPQGIAYTHVDPPDVEVTVSPHK
jgi:hypothetical protein